MKNIETMLCAVASEIGEAAEKTIKNENWGKHLYEISLGFRNKIDKD